MKKTLIFLLLTTIILNMTGCSSSNKGIKTDALKFKEEYEKLNGEKNSTGKEYRTLSIPEDNPFIYKSASDVVEMINNKETFAVYFGFDSCPWCRSVIPTLIEVAKDNNIEKIYYVDVKDIRDTIEINEDGQLETTKEGTVAYYELLELLDKVLNDYSLIDSDNKEVSTDEKRIYAPNIVIIVDGKAKKLESGISQKQIDGYMELTDEIKEDTYNKFNQALQIMYKKRIVCDNGC